jgi:hypothetical protein
MDGTRALVRCARALTLSRPRAKPYSELSRNCLLTLRATRNIRYAN